MPDVAYGSLPFKEQIAFFRRKLGNQLPTNAWTDIWQEAHDHAFVVAGANRADLLSDLAKAVDKTIAEGETLEDFRKRFDAIVARHGWNYKGGRNWRSRVIYETNLRTSYAAGRYEQLQKLKKVRPYWLYVHADGELHPRPMHKAWGDAKLTLSADDPWWHTHYPPNGWGCKCSIRALNARDLKRLGKDGPDKTPSTRMQEHIVGQRSPGGPRTVESPAGVDPGFGYAPGRDIWIREQATRAMRLESTQAKAQWEPVVTTTAQDYGRPSRIPLAPPPFRLGSRLQTAEQVTDALRQAMGADSAVFDVHGLPVAVDAEVLGSHIDPSRAEYLPWLPDLLRDPYEVWLQLERDVATGAYRTRARMLKAYDLGKGKALLLIADQQAGQFVGWTFIPARSLNYAAKQRQGLLWWAQ